MNKLRVVALTVACLLLPCKLALAQSSEQASARKKAIADLKEIAYAGNVAAQVQLGVIYLTGDGVAKDDAEAVKWLRKAADQDNALGERYLAEMYFKGRGVPADTTEAAKWLRLAAEQGDAESEHNLAVLYTQGEGVPRNVKEAANWMHKVRGAEFSPRDSKAWACCTRTATACARIKQKPQCGIKKPWTRSTCPP